MTSHSRSLILAASLIALPLAGALAQPNNPAGNYGSNKSMTAAPGTGDSKTMSGMSTGDANTTPAISPRAKNAQTPGATGRTVVPGSNSTIAGNASNSADQKTGGSIAGSSGGGSK